MRCCTPYHCAAQVIVIEGQLVKPGDPYAVGLVGADGRIQLSHTFPNGDVYSGGWDAGPDGNGSMSFGAGGRCAVRLRCNNARRVVCTAMYIFGLQGA